MVDAIMIGHVINKQLDPSRLPACLSKKIISNALRKYLKFNGIIISDNM